MLSFASPSGHEVVAACLSSEARRGERWMKIRVTNTTAGTPPSFRSYYQLLLSRERASGSFRPHRDKKSNDYRPRYCERASIVATDALGADKRWEEYNLLVSSGSPADDGSQCFLRTIVSPPLAPQYSLEKTCFEHLAVRTKCAEIPRDSQRTPVFIFSHVPFNDRQRGCDNSSWIIALARNWRLALRAKSG